MALLMLQIVCPARAQTADAPDADNDTTSPSAGQIASIAIPGAMVLHGLASLTSGDIRRLDCQTRDTILKNNKTWRTKADDYLIFAPAAAAFVMQFSGVKSRNSLFDMTAMYALSNVAQAAIVHTGKVITNRERPNGSNRRSFPSGHTATAFAAAEFLHQEYGYKSIFVSIAGYGVAAFAGAARVYKNRHWVSDVVAGAGTGILCTKGVYWIYPKLKEKWLGGQGRGKVMVMPVVEYGGKGASAAVVCRF